MFVATACSVQLLLELVVPDGADVTEKGLCATSLTTRNISLGCQIPIGLPSTLPSTSGWVFRFCTAGASWGSNNQKSVALSSCEAEIVASSEAAKEGVYLVLVLKHFLEGLERRCIRAGRSCRGQW